MIVKPLVFTVVLPAVTEVTSRSSFVATVYSSPPAAFLPFVTFTFLPSTTVVCFAAVSAAAFAASLTCLIASPMLPLPVSPIPFAGSATVTLPVAGSIAASGPIKSFTLFATLYNWLPLTASLLAAVTAPGATLVIFLSFAFKPSLLM